MKSEQDYHGDEVAIVGLSLRVPGANDPWRFWDNLANGIDSAVPLTDEALLEAGVTPQRLQDPALVKIKAALDDVAGFDARFFGLSPFDATLMDPQYRHFLELAWEALESAHVDPASFEGLIGVYGGSGQNGYLIHHLLSQPALIQNPGHWYLRHVGNDKDFMTTRVSYHLDLKGPSVNVQTACSTSLVAIHLATQALISQECDLALAGGITIEFPHGQGYLAQENGIEDPTGCCRSYDARSQGTVFSSGGGVVALKRLADAQRAGDEILGLIKASALSNDGAQKAGYTAPSVDGQVAAISEALALGEVHPDTIGYVEGHGTGTPIGDPIEVQALNTAWRAYTQRKQFAALSSVKSNVGHMDTAAGVISLIKAIGAVHYGIKFPTAHFESPNPGLELEKTPFYVSNRQERWQEAGPRRAAVSSLGVGGTNAHIIVEQAPDRPRLASISGPLVVPFSAKTSGSLQGYMQKLGRFLEQHPDRPLADIVKSLSQRRAFECRAVILADSTPALIDALREGRQTAFGAHQALSRVPKKIAFAFTGQGTQYFNMGRSLYHSNQVYRDHFDHCAELLVPIFGQDIRNIVFQDQPTIEDQAYLDRIDVTHPILFSVAYALAQAWISIGFKPDAMIGHSLGEYVAALIAGVFKLEQVLQLVCERGRLMQSTAEGVMISVAAEESVLDPILQEEEFRGRLSIAGVNVKGMIVVAGEPDAGHALMTRLESLEISAKLLRIPRASHSVLMDPILDEYEACVAACELSSPSIPIVSNIDGQWHQQLTDPKYWRRHLRSAVRFADGAETLMQDRDGYLFIEIGPGTQLTRLLEAHPSRGDVHAVINSIPGPKDVQEADSWFASGTARAWAVGAREHVGNPELESAQLTCLPTYAWDHRRFWVEQAPAGTQHALSIDEKRPMEHWFSLPDWQQTLEWSPGVPLNSQSKILIMTDVISETLAHCIAHWQASVQVIVVLRSDSQAFLGSRGAEVFCVSGFEPASYQWLYESIEASDSEILENLIAVIEWLEPPTVSDQDLHASARQYFDQALFHAKALGQLQWKSLNYLAIGNGLLRSHDQISTRQSLVQGPVRVLASEHSGIQSGFIDFDHQALSSPGFYARVLADITRDRHGQDSRHQTWDEVLYSGHQRLLRTYHPQISAEADVQWSQIRHNGCYVIAGLGDLALVTARMLIETHQARPVFLARSQFPEPADWKKVAASKRIDSQALRIRELLLLKDQCPDLLVLQADVTDQASMANAWQIIQAKLGPIHGVFHTAGVLDDQLIGLKTIEQAYRVLGPKVFGLEFYETLFQSQALDFLVLFSSTSSFLGLAGQADYASANGYLAAWARWQQQQGRPVCAIHWGAWAQVGMAAQLGVSQGIVESVEPFEVSGLKACHWGQSAKGSSRVCVGLFHQFDWPLNDHRTRKGLAIMPGTGMINLIANTHQHLTGQTFFSIENLHFQTPFAVDHGPVLAGVVAEFHESSTGYTFVSADQLESLVTHQFQRIHCEASVRPLVMTELPSVDIEAFKLLCPRHVTYENNTHAHMNFGPRWQCLPEAWLGQGQALLRLSLPAQFHQDLDNAPWHPGLLDLAIAGQLLLTFNESQDFYVPLFYERIDVYSSLETECYSIVKLKSSAQSPELAIVDVQIFNIHGQGLMSIQGFHLKKMSEHALDIAPIKNVDAGLSLVEPVTRGDQANPLALSLSRGITPHQGRQVLARLLQIRNLPPQIVISSVPLQYAPHSGGEVVANQVELAPRPPLSVAYEAPEGPLEQTIAELWCQSLGLETIGRFDQFFELGGHSLMLIQVIAKLKKKIATQVPMEQLFEAVTIAQWAKSILKLTPRITVSGDDRSVGTTAAELRSDLDGSASLTQVNASQPVMPVNRQQFSIG